MSFNSEHQLLLQKKKLPKKGNSTSKKNRLSLGRSRLEFAIGKYIKNTAL